MRKILVFVLVSFLLTSVYGQDTVFYKYNSIPVNSIKEALVYGILEKDEDNPNQVIETKFTADRKIVSRTFYINYANKVKHGEQMFWNDEQKLAITKQFKNDSLHGYYRRFTDQGKLAKETLYNFGQSVKDTVFISEKEDSSAYKDGFKSIMSMAIFPGCESVENSKSREQCTEIAIQDYIKENTRYPENVRDAGYTGRIVMSFIIDGDGEVSKLKIIESVEFGKELEDEAIRVIMSLPKMIPASSYGESCRIQYTVPVNFKLQGGGIPLKVIGEKIKEEKELKQFEIVEDMPVWPTCTTEISRLEKEQCTNLEIMKFVANSAKEKYPKDLKKGKIGGRAYCRFVINEVGNVEDVMIIRPTGNAILDSISREVIRSFPLLAPATQDGKPVKVQYTVPVNFR